MVTFWEKPMVSCGIILIIYGFHMEFLLRNWFGEVTLVIYIWVSYGIVTSELVW